MGPTFEQSIDEIFIFVFGSRFLFFRSVVRSVISSGNGDNFVEIERASSFRRGRMIMNSLSVLLTAFTVPDLPA